MRIFKNGFSGPAIIALLMPGARDSGIIATLLNGGFHIDAPGGLFQHFT